MLASAGAQQISTAETDEKSRLIEETLAAFNVPVQVVETRVGPTVSQFGLRPAPGITVQRIKRLQDDLMLALAAPSLRVETPVPGRPVVGIEIPNSGISVVGLREVLESKGFARDKGTLKIALGSDVEGKPRLGDLAKMPHLLIAGQTGSGKSVCINTIVASLLYQGTPDTLQLLMIDPKMVELVEYEGYPHLRYPVVVELSEAAKVLLWAVDEMERRYRLLKDAGYRNIQTYNNALANRVDGDESDDDGPQPLPYLVLIIDELADLMMFAPDDVEPAICRLTAKSRAVGIHLVVATQRPSVDVVTGLIKANMPSRIAFAVSSQTDSRVILDTGGAETLLGRGDMLYLPYDSGRAVRVQCAYVSDEEITGLVEFWKAQGTPDYVDEEEIAHLQLKEDEAPETARENPELDMALGAIEELDYTSVSWLQRKLGIGYPQSRPPHGRSRRAWHCREGRQPRALLPRGPPVPPLRPCGASGRCQARTMTTKSRSEPHPPAPSPLVERESPPPYIPVVSSVIPAQAGIHVPLRSGGAIRGAILDLTPVPFLQERGVRAVPGSRFSLGEDGPRGARQPLPFREGVGGRYALSDPSDPAAVAEFVGAVATLLVAGDQTLGVAESSTGGLMGHWLTDRPGASRWFLGGVIAYHNQLKIELLHAPASLFHS